jgi:hypothetical protein
MKVGDKVKICAGSHIHKTGTIISTCGVTVSNWVMVQLDQFIQGCCSTGPGNPARRAAVSLSHLTLGR